MVASQYQSVLMCSPESKSPDSRPGRYLSGAVVIREGRREWHQMGVMVAMAD